MLTDPSHEVRDFAFTVAPSRKGFLIRNRQFAYIQYGEDARGGMELFDVATDPKQYTNLANDPGYASTVEKNAGNASRQARDDPRQ